MVAKLNQRSLLFSALDLIHQSSIGQTKYNNNRKDVNNTLPHKTTTKLDDLGRIQIVKEIRKLVGVEEGDTMLIEVNENGQIILTKCEDKV